MNKSLLVVHRLGSAARRGCQPQSCQSLLFLSWCHSALSFPSCSVTNTWLGGLLSPITSAHPRTAGDFLERPRYPHISFSAVSPPVSQLDTIPSSSRQFKGQRSFGKCQRTSKSGTVSFSGLSNKKTWENRADLMKHVWSIHSGRNRGSRLPRRQKHRSWGSV